MSVGEFNLNMDTFGLNGHKYAEAHLNQMKWIKIN